MSPLAITYSKGEKGRFFFLNSDLFEFIEVFYNSSWLNCSCWPTSVLERNTHIVREREFLVILHGGYEIFVSSPKVQNVSNVA